MQSAVSNRRLWLFRIGAIALGLAPFLFAEFTLHWLRWPPASLADPFVDLHNLRPLFVQADDGQMRIAEERLNLFQPASFPIRKQPDAFRIFALGGSTTQGEPYSTPTAFPKWLEISLQAAAPAQTIEVINCGGLSYASYRVLAILNEVLNYAPDLIVVYTGHNEYLERRSYDGLGALQPTTAWSGILKRIRLVHSLKVLVGSKGQSRYLVKNPTQLQTEVDALLDYQGGLEQYERDAAWLSGVENHFEWNIRMMMTACEEAGIPVVFVAPTSNLADCPPFKFEPAPDLSAAQSTRFDALWELARSTDDSQKAETAIRQALAIDPKHAGANFLLGRIRFERKDYSSARPLLQRARDYDVCPLRAPTWLVATVRRVAAEESVSLLDADELFASRSLGQIVGDSLLVDHVHPTVEGHQLLGHELAALVLSEGLLATDRSAWRAIADKAMAAHLQELNAAYFQRGAQRLQGLRLWTQGRARKVREQ